MRHTVHRDKQRFDEVRICTIPRYKESELSGDEWRFHAEIEYLYKGQVVLASRASNVEYALRLADARFIMDQSDGKYQPPKTDNLCDQEGCGLIASYFFQLKKKFNRDGTEYAPHADGEYVQFCSRHKVRGDCGLEDADSNYVVLAEKPQ